MAGIGTDSMMYQTMMRQPADLAALLGSGWKDAETAATKIAESERVIVTGIGTSYHAALVGSWLFREAGSDSRAISSFDLATYPESFPLSDSDAVIVMAHTGVKSYSAIALQRAVASGATVLSVGSQQAEHPGSSLILRTIARETSAAYTSSHTSAMTVLAQIATVLGEMRGRAETSLFRANLQRLPEQVTDALSRLSAVEPVAEYGASHQTYGTGAGPNEATALELVIKCREAAYAKVDGMAAEQFLHGPMVAVNEGDLAVVVQAAGESAERVNAITSVLEGMGTKLWAVGQTGGNAVSTTTFDLPELPEVLSPILTVIPMQMLAYAMATVKGLDPDTFRKNDPTYKAAFDRLTL
jgi:glutamine---fructose-6-phosphate transaminase (isomerizing)